MGRLKNKEVQPAPQVIILIPELSSPKIYEEKMEDQFCLWSCEKQNNIRAHY